MGEGIKPIGDESQFGDEWLKKCRKEASNIDKAKFTELGEKLRVFAEPYSNQIASLSSKFPNGPANIDLQTNLTGLKNKSLHPSQGWKLRCNQKSVTISKVSCSIIPQSNLIWIKSLIC